MKEKKKRDFLKGRLPLVIVFIILVALTYFLVKKFGSNNTSSKQTYEDQTVDFTIFKKDVKLTYPVAKKKSKFDESLLEKFEGLQFSEKPKAYYSGILPDENKDIEMAYISLEDEKNMKSTKLVYGKDKEVFNKEDYFFIYDTSLDQYDFRKTIYKEDQTSYSYELTPYRLELMGEGKSINWLINKNTLKFDYKLPDNNHIGLEFEKDKEDNLELFYLYESSLVDNEEVVKKLHALGSKASENSSLNLNDFKSEDIVVLAKNLLKEKEDEVQTKFGPDFNQADWDQFFDQLDQEVDQINNLMDKIQNEGTINLKELQ